MQAGPFQHQLHGQGLPGLAAVAGDQGQLGEVVHDPVEALHVLAVHGQPRAGHPRAHEDGDIELAARCVHRVPLGVVDGDLREAPGREGAHCPDVVGLLAVADLAHRAHHVVGVGLAGGHEPVGMVGQSLAVHLALAADQAPLDAVGVHLAQGECDGIVRAVLLLGHALEHVLHREVELGRLGVLELLADELVVLEVLGGEADHRVDDPRVGRHWHGVGSVRYGPDLLAGPLDL